MLANQLPAIALLLLLAGCSGQDSRPATGSVAAKQLSSNNQPQKLYAEMCASCHGPDGRGGVGPDLSASRYRYGKQSSEIEQSIMQGRPGGMPAFASHLTAEQAAALAEYLRSM